MKKNIQELSKGLMAQFAASPFLFIHIDKKYKSVYNTHTMKSAEIIKLLKNDGWGFMKYPVFIVKDKNSDYGVTVPDLPGCFSAGVTLEEALINAQEAIAAHCEGLLMDGERIPHPEPIEEHQKKIKNKKAVWALVDFNIITSSGKARRINLTIPEKILRRLDDHARKKGESRSGFIVSAALDYMNSEK